MKYASDFRSDARAALRGKWPLAVLTAFVAVLIGGAVSESDGTSAVSNRNAVNTDFLSGMEPLLTAVLIVLCIRLVLSVFIGGMIAMGYSRFNLNLVDGKKARFGDLFSCFHRFNAGFDMQVLLVVYLILWSMLFVIPGIVKSYSYAMTRYILAEHPEYSPNDAITRSREVMDGNKFRLFCLWFSFIGWSFLCSVPATFAVYGLLTGVLPLLLLFPVAVIGESMVHAYREAATAAFYREITSDTRQAEPTEPDTESENQIPSEEP